MDAYEIVKIYNETKNRDKFVKSVLSDCEENDVEKIREWWYLIDATMDLNT